jgi:hypothetical protein
MVFMKCVRKVDRRLEYLVGQDREKLLFATENGRRHRQLPYSRHEFVDQAEVPASKLRNLSSAIAEVQNGRRAVWIGIAD